MKNTVKRALSLTLCFAMLAAFGLPALAVEEDVHDCLDCSGHGAVSGAALPVFEPVIPGGGAVTMAAADCVHYYVQVGEAAVFNVTTSTHYAYPTPSGVGILCTMTTTTYSHFMLCNKGCGQEGNYFLHFTYVTSHSVSSSAHKYN